MPQSVNESLPKFLGRDYIIGIFRHLMSLPTEITPAALPASRFVSSPGMNRRRFGISSGKSLSVQKLINRFI